MVDVGGEGPDSARVEQGLVVVCRGGVGRGVGVGGEGGEGTAEGIEGDDAAEEEARGGGG